MVEVGTVPAWEHLDVIDAEPYWGRYGCECIVAADIDRMFIELFQTALLYHETRYKQENHDYVGFPILSSVHIKLQIIFCSAQSARTLTFVDAMTEEGKRRLFMAVDGWAVANSAYEAH